MNAFTLMENNVLEIESADLAAFYVKDFEQLFEKENLVETGKIEPIRVG